MICYDQCDITGYLHAQKLPISICFLQTVESICQQSSISAAAFAVVRQAPAIQPARLADLPLACCGSSVTRKSESKEVYQAKVELAI